MITPATGEIDTIVKKIADTIPVKKIILFGSFAYGTPTEHSDIDLCVISDDNRRKIEILHEIRKKIRGVKYPVDILVYNSDEFSKRSDSLTSMERYISQKGIVVYE
ncbi:MAG TPA: nucleotidyltransferase domain-containing protein [Spirochaetota bacterium]|nr:nucleotidyltransferase domain-containing protein [Spirochaetota bacterium]HPF07700.1 nucleotidyltransferase domain-containing protein [Spirochaetota bacterium]HRX49705.1 nucleotidyltransferase domain-containing protein [Spirochaetota bacterium]